MMTWQHVPSRRLIWLDFLQMVAIEQAGRRPALVLSPHVFNQLTGRCIACPITRRDRHWSFHVPIPDGHEISGVVQADHCAASHGSSEDPILYAKLRPACLTKCEQSSNRCSHFNSPAKRYCRRRHTAFSAPLFG